jgi:hypothetical protein
VKKPTFLFQLLAPIAAVTLLVTACGGGSATNEAEATSPDSASASPGESEAVEMVSITVVNFAPGNAIRRIGQKGVEGSGLCAMGVGSVINGAGEDVVTLEVSGEDSKRESKMVASPTNGDQLPCSVEATFTDVPSGADYYTAQHQSRNKTVTGVGLASAGNQIDIVEDEKIGIDDVLDAYKSVDCLENEPFAVKILKNFDSYRGPGKGNDIAVKFRMKLTNNCEKDIKAFEIGASFEDPFGDVILTTTDEKYSKTIKVGKSWKTPEEDTAYTIDRSNDDFSAWDSVKPRELTKTGQVKTILFKDGTSATNDF